MFILVCQAMKEICKYSLMSISSKHYIGNVHQEKQIIKHPVYTINIQVKLEPLIK